MPSFLKSNSALSNDFARATKSAEYYKQFPMYSSAASHWSGLKNAVFSDSETKTQTMKYHAGEITNRMLSPGGRDNSVVKKHAGNLMDELTRVPPLPTVSDARPPSFWQLVDATSTFDRTLLQEALCNTVIDTLKMAMIFGPAHIR